MIKKIFRNWYTFRLRLFLFYSPADDVIYPKRYSPSIPLPLQYYNGLGLLVFKIHQIVCYFLGRRLQVQLEYFDQVDPINSQEGAQDRVWPIPTLIEKERPKRPSEKLITRLSDSYNLAIKWDPNQFENSSFWEEQVAVFREHMFNKEGEIDSDFLSEFRMRDSAKARIVSDQNEVIRPDLGQFRSLLNSLRVVDTYHRYSRAIPPWILTSLSESYVGANLCPVYFSQRLSERLLRHGYYLSQLKTHLHYEDDESITFLDLGGAYGGFTRLLSYFYPNSRHIIVELPEIALFAGYFLHECIPNKRVGLLSDLNFNGPEDELPWNDFDILVLPTWAITNIPSDSIDVSINTVSLGEMSKTFGQFYLAELERITKTYFYSSNRPFSHTKQFDDFGFYHWQFRKTWLTKLYSTSPAGHVEWLGRKINRST